MKTDVETRMQAVAKGGYKAIVARHILHGQKQRQDRQLAEIIARTAVKMERLNAEEVEHIELTVDAFIKRHEMSKEAPESPKIGMCGRCYDEDVKVFPANCAEKPEALAGQPIGQYHCPDCGAMVMASLPHPDLCQKCLDRSHPDFDKPPSAPESPANSTGIGGDCSNCGRENVQLYAHTSNDKSQTIDVCQDCLRRWT